MSSRRLAVVNPLSHPSILTETGNSEKSTKLFTPPARARVNIRSSESNSSITLTHNPSSDGSISEEILTVLSEKDEVHGSGDKVSRPCVRTEHGYAGATDTGEKSKPVTRDSREQSPVAICRELGRPSHMTGTEIKYDSPPVIRTGSTEACSTEIGLKTGCTQAEAFDAGQIRVAQAIHDFYDPCIPNALTFHKGDLLSVFCNPSTPTFDRHTTYRGFRTAHGPNTIGLIPGWAITFGSSSKPDSGTPQDAKIKVDFAVQTDFPDDVGDEYFTDSDESCSSEAEPDNASDPTGKPITVSHLTPARGHLMSSSVELQSSRQSGPASPSHTPNGTIMMLMMSHPKSHKSSICSNESVGHRVLMQPGNATTQTMTSCWDNQKRHSAASLDSGRDSTYAGSSEGSGGTQTTHPPPAGIVRSSQPNFDRTPLTLNITSGKLDAHSDLSNIMMQCSFPGSVYPRNNTLVSSRAPLGPSNPIQASISYGQPETGLGLSPADSLSESSQSFALPYNCSSLPTAASTIPPIFPGTHQQYRPTSSAAGRSLTTEHACSPYVAQSPGLSPMEYRPSHSVFHSPHPSAHTKRFAYRPVDYFEFSARRSDMNRDPLGQWLHSVGLSRLEEPLSTAGFDLWTLCRATPEELNACGITNPADRQLLRMELNRLQLPDLIPEQLPVKVYDWLAQLNLAAYWPFFREQNICTFEQVAKLTWEDMEEVGISKLGHQKKLLLAINRLTRQLSSTNSQTHKEPLVPYTVVGQETMSGYRTNQFSSLGYTSSHCSSASIASPVVPRDADSISSLIPTKLTSRHQSTAIDCLTIVPSSSVRDEAEQLGDSPPFPPPPPAFQDPVPIPPSESTNNPSLDYSSLTGSNPNNASSAVLGSTLPPPVPTRRSSITDSDCSVQITAKKYPDQTGLAQGMKSSLGLRLPRLARRAQSTAYSHGSDQSVRNVTSEVCNNLTRRSSSPSLYPPKSDSSVDKEQLTKWSSGQLATPQICFPSNFETPLDPELQDMSDIRAMLDALSEHLTSATQL